MRRGVLLVVALAAVGLTRCGTPEAPGDPVVVAGHGVAVTQRAFADEYRQFASLAPIRDGLDSRRAYALQMLERAYIAAIADSAGLGDLPEVRAHVARRRAFAMRRHFLTDSLEALIDEPTEAEVREAFRRQNTRVRVRHAFAPTEAGARRLAARIRAGEPFEAVARSSFAALGIAATGDLGWVSFNDLDEAPEAAVFALDSGAVSAPVASLRGWHVFQSLGREETVRLDGTAFANARERLAFDLRHRRIEEASARAIRPLLEAHELAVRLAPLRALWPSLEPLVPARGEADVLAAARTVLPALQPEGVTRATPVATVDGQAFTVGQLLDALPDVPVEFWTPDLRKAVEVAVRDSILTARSAAAGAADAPDVARETAAARRTALYYAGLRAAADTVRLDRHTERFYRLWRDAFTTERTTAYQAWPFESAAAARTALAAATPWSELTSEARSHTAPRGEPGPFGIHRAPLGTAAARELAGPFPDGGRFWVVEAISRRDAVVPYAKARADVLAAMEAEPRSVVHRLLLDTGFDDAAVTFDDDALAASLPLGLPALP